MTLFDFNRNSEIEDPGWEVNTLQPPLKFKDVLNDFKIQWICYMKSYPSFSKSLVFLVLRVFQRFSYNFGWVKSKRDYWRNQNER